jgi:hypothetical protein
VSELIIAVHLSNPFVFILTEIIVSFSPKRCPLKLNFMNLMFSFKFGKTFTAFIVAVCPKRPREQNRNMIIDFFFMTSFKIAYNVPALGEVASFGTVYFRLN